VVVEELIRALRSKDERQIDRAVSAAVVQLTTIEWFHGPLPSPRVLKEFGEVLPGLEREIVDAWHEERRHRHQIENGVVREESAQVRRSQTWAGAICVGLIGLAFVALLRGEWGAALGFAASGALTPLVNAWLGSPVKSLFGGRSNDSKSKEQPK
jgi:uncharacterized membrane protein